MNRAEYITELMKKDVELIGIAQRDVNQMKLAIEDDLKKAEEKCDSYEELYKDDNNRIMDAYVEYETIRSPLTELESLLYDFKRNLIDHYEQLLIEKRVYDTETVLALANSRTDVVKLDETVEIIKGVLI